MKNKDRSFSLESQENKLRRILHQNGYTLGRKDSGYRIGDKVTNSVYLGKNHNATLEDVIKFINNIDEGGYSEINAYQEDMDSDDGDYAESIEMEIANLTRHMETLILQGKHSQAAELAEKIKELEEEIEDEDEGF